MAMPDQTALLQQMYSRMSLDQLKELRENVLSQLAILELMIQDRSPEVSGDD